LAPFVIVLPLLAMTSDQPLQNFSWFDVKLTALIGAPFTVTGSFLVVWPTYALQRGKRSELRKSVVVLWISAIAGFLMLMPFADEFPWEGAVCAVGTAGLWLFLNRATLPVFNTPNASEHLHG
jgi:hypothetical protein